MAELDTNKGGIYFKWWDGEETFQLIYKEGEGEVF